MLCTPCDVNALFLMQVGMCAKGQERRPAGHEGKFKDILCFCFGSLSFAWGRGSDMLNVTDLCCF